VSAAAVTVEGADLQQRTSSFLSASLLFCDFLQAAASDVVSCIFPLFKQKKPLLFCSRIENNRVTNKQTDRQQRCCSVVAAKEMEAPSSLLQRHGYNLLMHSSQQQQQQQLHSQPPPPPQQQQLQYQHQQQQQQVQPDSHGFTSSGGAVAAVSLSGQKRDNSGVPLLPQPSQGT